jgi:hypothetical protein
MIKLHLIFFFIENMHEKPLEFGHIHENITYFCIFEMSKNKI